MLLAPVGAVEAAEPVAAPANISVCTSMSDPTARLACYDAAFNRPKATPSAARGAEPPSAAVAVTASSAEQRFGDTGQLPGDAEARRSLPSRLVANVKRVAALPNGRYRLTLDNSQVWQTTEAAWAVVFNKADHVIIYRLPLGGYQIARAGENRTLGVERTQ